MAARYGVPMFVTVPADRYSCPPLTVPLRFAGGAVVQVAVLSHRRAADLLLLEVDAGEGSVVVPQVRCPWRPT